MNGALAKRATRINQAGPAPVGPAPFDGVPPLSSANRRNQVFADPLCFAACHTPQARSKNYPSNGAEFVCRSFHQFGPKKGATSGIGHKSGQRTEILSTFTITSVILQISIFRRSDRAPFRRTTLKS